MAFEVKGKVAIVTGGASGLGYYMAKDLLEQGLKGVALLDINDEKGQEVKTEFNKEFGENSCIFIKVDTSDEAQMEDAFQLTVDTYKQLDIVINNAGIVSEYDWKKCININLVGYIIGTKLAIDNYLPKYKSGPEGVILNIASIAGLDIMSMVPVYTITKHGIVALGRSFGANHHYQRTNVKVLTVCPGQTATPMTLDANPERRHVEYSKFCSVTSKNFLMQTPIGFGKLITNIIQNGGTGSVWVIEAGEPAYEVEFQDRHSMRKNI